MKRPLAYITAEWSGDEYETTNLAAYYCRKLYDAGFSPICPIMYLPLFLKNEIPEEHKSGIDMSREILRRSHVVVVCGDEIGEVVKSDIATAARLSITTTTLNGILAVTTQGKSMKNDD